MLNDSVEIYIMKDWIKDFQSLLLSCLIEYDEKKNEILPSQKEIILNRDEELIAKAINRSNIDYKR